MKEQEFMDDNNYAATPKEVLRAVEILNGALNLLNGGATEEAVVKFFEKCKEEDNVKDQS